MKPFYRYVKLGDQCHCGSGCVYRACCFRGELIGLVVAMAVWAALLFLPSSSWPARIRRGGFAGHMDTRQLIYVIVKDAFGILYLAGISYSLYVGVRRGFHFPRPLHIMAVGIVIFEAGVLVVFPLQLASITPVLGSVLVISPLTPYIGWIVAGGPQK